MPVDAVAGGTWKDIFACALALIVIPLALLASF